MNTTEKQQPDISGLKIDQDFLVTKAQEAPSVRSTFTLTHKADKILTAISEQTNITQRELFDQVFRSDWLPRIIESIKNGEATDKRSVRRTLVLSRSALEMLDQTSKESEIKRDDLACWIIVFFAVLYNNMVTMSKEQLRLFRDFLREASYKIELQPAFDYIDANAPDNLREQLKDKIDDIIQIGYQWVLDQVDDVILGRTEYAFDEYDELLSMARLEPIKFEDNES